MQIINKLLLNKTGNYKKVLKEFLFINFGIFIVAIGIHVFKNPNHFALGGISGLSLLVSSLYPGFKIGGIMMGLNIFLILLGYIFLGKKVAVKSFYGSFALSGMVWLLEILFPINAPLTNQKFMELLYGVFLPGIGGGIVFNFGATTGGTDIIAKILSKFFRLKVSVGLLFADFIIALCAGLLFGIESCLFSIMGVCLKSFVIDAFLESVQVYKIIVIISKKSSEIKDYICNDLNRGATIHHATGAYTVDEKEVITTVMDRRQALKLQIFCNTIDPEAFITISNSSRILGKGFQRFE